MELSAARVHSALRASTLGGLATALVLGGIALLGKAPPWGTPPTPSQLLAATAPSTTVPLVVPSVVPAAITSVAPVAPLGQLLLPDLADVGQAAVPAAALTAVRALPGVTSVLVFAVGQVRVNGAAATVIGVDPSAFRGATPAPTASADDLWASVARGELLAEPGTARLDRLQLGAGVPVQGAGVLRLGSVAALGIPGVDALVDDQLASRLHLTEGAGFLVLSDGKDVAGLATEVGAILDPAAVAPPAGLVDVAPTTGATVQGGRTLTQPLYAAAAATCPGLPWTVLAAIGTIESDNGANPGVSSAGAVGPMQFLPSTFAEYAVDGDGDGRADIDDPADAVYSAARMLCSDGSAADGWRGAVFAYNHAGWYVDAVEDLAARYAAAA